MPCGGCFTCEIEFKMRFAFVAAESCCTMMMMRGQHRSKILQGCFRSLVILLIPFATQCFLSLSLLKGLTLVYDERQETTSTESKCLSMQSPLA